MTDTRSLQRSEEDPNELLAEFDELLSDSFADEPLSAAPAGNGTGPSGQTPEESATEDFEDLEALFETFYDEDETAGSGGIASPAEGETEAGKDGDSDGEAFASAASAGPLTEAVAGADGGGGEQPADDGSAQAAVGAPAAPESVSGDADPDDNFAEPAAGEDAEAVQSAGTEVESLETAEAGEKRPTGGNPSLPAVESAGESPEAASAFLSAEKADAAGPAGDAKPAQERTQTTIEDGDGEPADEVFPFVPAGTPIDTPPRRTFSESATAVGAGPGSGGVQKLTFVAGGLIALVAAGAGLLAWEAYSGLQTLNERLAGQPAAASAANLPGAAVAIERRLDELSLRLEALAESAPERERELAGLRAEVQAAAGRVAGLDARLEALRARLGTSATGAADAVGGAAKWVVNLASLADEASAGEELARIRGMGIDAEIAPAPADGRTWYRIRVAGFDSAAAAKRYAQSKAAGAGFEEAWVARQ